MEMQPIVACLYRGLLLCYLISASKSDLGFGTELILIDGAFFNDFTSGETLSTPVLFNLKLIILIWI